jgi:hypothetical protein
LIRNKEVGLSLLRQPVGSSDFALDDYSYDDLLAGETDPELRKVSIKKDQRYIILILREALASNPNLKIMATICASRRLANRVEFVWHGQSGGCGVSQSGRIHCAAGVGTAVVNP